MTVWVSQSLTKRKPSPPPRPQPKLASLWCQKHHNNITTRPQPQHHNHKTATPTPFQICFFTAIWIIWHKRDDPEEKRYSDKILEECLRRLLLKTVLEDLFQDFLRRVLLKTVVEGCLEYDNVSLAEIGDSLDDSRSEAVFDDSLFLKRTQPASC